jgi:hypothetical protein
LRLLETPRSLASVVRRHLDASTARPRGEPGAEGERRRQTVGDYAAHTQPTLPWELFEDWFGEAGLRERVEALSRRVDRDGLPERTRAALDAAERYAAGELTNDERL